MIYGRAKVVATAEREAVKVVGVVTVAEEEVAVDVVGVVAMAEETAVKVVGVVTVAEEATVKVDGKIVWHHSRQQQEMNAVCTFTTAGIHYIPVGILPTRISRIPTRISAVFC